jgi:hypothetical protein
MHKAIAAGTLKEIKSTDTPSGSTFFIEIILKGLSHEMDFKNFDKNLQNQA